MDLASIGPEPGYNDYRKCLTKVLISTKAVEAQAQTTTIIVLLFNLFYSPLLQKVFGKAKKKDMKNDIHNHIKIIS